MTHVATTNGLASRKVARPMRVLVPLIKDEITLGDREGERASEPHYETAGIGLIDAACIDETQGAAEFWDWATETFERKKKILRAYMELAFENNTAEMESRGFETLADLLRHKNKTSSHHPGERGRVHDAIKADMHEVKTETYAVPKMKPTNEKALRKKLALQLIDIGYKALATKWHPDKRGGSAEAMVRLNAVRALLKNAVR